MPTPVEIDVPSKPGSRPLPKDACLLTVLSGSQRGVVMAVPDGAELLVGRGDYADLRLLDPGVSWVHARIRRAGQAVTIEDMHSTNGTWIGAERVAGKAVLDDGVHVGLGKHTVIRFTRCDAMELEATLQQYETAIRDPLTGIYNRGYFDERLESEVAFAHRHETPLSILMFDIDHFKLVNDRFGHPVGDAALRVVTESVRRMLRPEDVFARYGGEEFVILARDVTLENATILARRIREHIERLQIPWDSEIVKLTISVGVAGIAPGGPPLAARELVGAADHAMYEAKSRGRNRVVSVPAPPPG